MEVRAQAQPRRKWVYAHILQISQGRIWKCMRRNSNSKGMETTENTSEEVIERCLELQATELETLLSIYSSSAVKRLPSTSTSTTTISISIQIDLLKPVPVTSDSDGGQEDPSSRDSPVERSTAELRFLPPFELVARLPKGYPLMEPPRLTIVSDWARRRDVDRGEEEIGGMWTAWRTMDEQGRSVGQECLGLCVDWLEHDWLLPIASPLILFRNFIPSPHWTRFREHDHSLRHLEFLNRDFVCPICLDTRKGRQCIKLEYCGHIFCQECLKDFFSLMIKEGEVRKIGCCKEGCTKSGAGIGPEELEELVGRDLRIRYESLVLKLALDSDPSITLCPMHSCQSLVSPDLALDGTRSEHLRVCLRCGYSFCFVCKKTWHGPTNKCSIPYLDRLIEEYLDEQSSNSKRIEIERRVGGQKKLQKLIDEYLEERANREWKTAHTTTCVTCFIPVEKSEGCNHMICTKCQTHFCFRCGLKLSPTQPYLHFSTPESACFNQLMNIS
ncbi:translation termination inhibitor protein itt1 [Puccinia graminis f. sp. tritici]|nr:translation termination inhibitor protein itt1 [Puccinia graminis f. sp. tritici]